MVYNRSNIMKKNPRGKPKGSGPLSSDMARADIIASRATGERNHETAKRYNVTPQAISRIVSIPHIKAQIEATKKRIQEQRTIRLLEPAFDLAEKDIALEGGVTDMIADDIEVGNVPPQGIVALKNALSKTKEKVLEKEGVFSTPARDQYNTQINQYNAKIDPNVLKMLTGAFNIEAMPMNEEDEPKMIEVE